MTREVTVASSAANKAKAWETNATTWAQLKSEMPRNGMSLDGVEAVMSPGNVTLNRDDAALHDGPFRIYLVPTKNKAGNGTAEGNTGKMTPLHEDQEVLNALRHFGSKATPEQMAAVKGDIIRIMETFYSDEMAEPVEAAGATA